MQWRLRNLFCLTFVRIYWTNSTLQRLREWNQAKNTPNEAARIGIKSLCRIKIEIVYLVFFIISMIGNRRWSTPDFWRVRKQRNRQKSCSSRGCWLRCLRLDFWNCDSRKVEKCFQSHFSCFSWLQNTKNGRNHLKLNCFSLCVYDGWLVVPSLG